MAAQGFTPTTWTNEPVSSAKLNQMAQNDQWLYENSVKFDYNVSGICRSSGLKIAVAYIYCPANGGRYSESTFFFGDFFTPGTNPVIVGGNFGSGRIIDTWIGFRGIDQWLPDHRGVQGWVAHPALLEGPTWIAFAAIGI
jgi:hypothetical protein